MKPIIICIVLAFCAATTSCENSTAKKRSDGEKSGFKSQTIIINNSWYDIVEDTNTGSKYLFGHYGGAVKLDR